MLKPSNQYIETKQVYGYNPSRLRKDQLKLKPNKNHHCGEPNWWLSNQSYPKSACHLINALDGLVYGKIDRKPWCVKFESEGFLQIFPSILGKDGLK